MRLRHRRGDVDVDQTDQVTPERALRGPEVDEEGRSGSEQPPAPPTVTRAELAAELAVHLAGQVMGLDPRAAQLVIRELEATVTRRLVAGQVVMLGGFLKLTPKTRAARRGRNPRTGETMLIPARRVVQVRALKHLADEVAGGTGGA